MKEHFVVIEYPSAYLRFGLIYKGPKPKTTEEGWQKTFGKWEMIVEVLEEDPELPLADGGANTCGLCDLFSWAKPQPCLNCPIADFMGVPYCEGTPYEDWEDDINLGNAQAELEFLKEVYKWWKKKN